MENEQEKRIICGREEKSCIGRVSRQVFCFVFVMISMFHEYLPLIYIFRKEPFNLKEIETIASKLVRLVAASDVIHSVVNFLLNHRELFNKL